MKSLRQKGNRYERTFQTLYLSGQPILKINKQNEAIYTIQQPIKLHLRSPKTFPTIIGGKLKLNSYICIGVTTSGCHQCAVMVNLTVGHSISLAYWRVCNNLGLCVCLLMKSSVRKSKQP